MRDRPILKVFGLAWFWRFVAVSPALAAPFLVAHGLGGLGFALILVGIALFNMLRGIGLIGNNPVLATSPPAGRAAGGRTRAPSWSTYRSSARWPGWAPIS